MITLYETRTKYLATNIDTDKEEEQEENRRNRDVKNVCVKGTVLLLKNE